MTPDRVAVRVGVLLAVGLCGCGGRPATHPVSGRVTLAGGTAAQLTGHTVEAALTTDRTVRAFGVIEEDGRFSLQTLDGGNVRNGARPGTYEVRILVNREGDGRDRPPPLAPRFLNFETSGLGLEVPPQGEVRLEVAAR